MTSQVGDVIYVKLEKRDRGLGFSILDSLVCVLLSLFYRSEQVDQFNDKHGRLGKIMRVIE